MLESTTERIESIFARAVDLPTRPEIATRLLNAIERDASQRELASWISSDIGLTSRVLRLANSAFFYLQEPVASVRQAAALVGTGSLRSLARGDAGTAFFEADGERLDPVELWRHSLAVALAAGRLVREDLSDIAHVAGLLHDAPLALFWQHLPEETTTLLRASGGDNVRLRQLEREILGSSHVDVAGQLAARWRLPVAVRGALRRFETPSVEGGDDEALVAGALCVAEVWAEGNGFELLRREAASLRTPVDAWALEATRRSLDFEATGRALAEVADSVLEIEERCGLR